MVAQPLETRNAAMVGPYSPGTEFIQMQPLQTRNTAMVGPYSPGTEFIQRHPMEAPTVQGANAPRGTSVEFSKHGSPQDSVGIIGKSSTSDNKLMCMNFL